MSGQWEVVGKNKKDKQTGKTKKMSKNEKKKFVDNAPKVEDFLPLAQVKTLYAALDSNKESVKPVEKAVKTKENEAKKAQKKPKEKKEPVVKENKPPKTIEAAVALITTSDVENVLEVGQVRFSEAPLVWLKGLASWLNTKLPVDHMDNTFTAKSWEYPLCLLSPDTRAVLKKAVKGVPNTAVQMFYDYCLTSMANDMTKGGPVTGYKMLLQLVASQVPSVAAADTAKNADLRHSYQNRPAIGCSIMWALGQAGFKDISVGLKVWQEVMFPVYELRNYSNFVSDYLKHLLARHSTSKALTAQQYLAVVDTVLSSRQPGTNLIAHLHTLQGVVFNVQPDERLHSLFEPLLTRLSAKNTPALNNEVSRFLATCLVSDPQACGLWRQLYTLHMPHSAILLQHLNADWNNRSSSSLRDLVRTFKVTNDNMLRLKQKTEGLQECTRICDVLVGKQPKGRSFPWKTLSFLLILGLAGLVAVDVKSHTSLAASRTGQLLKKAGGLEYAELALDRTRDASQKLYRWGEQNIPLYTAQAPTWLKTALAIAASWLTALAHQVAAIGNMIVQYCLDKKPIIEQWVNENEWLRENAFVRSLSLENLQRVTLEALNTTQTFAAQTLSWLNSQVITTESV